MRDTNRDWTVKDWVGLVTFGNNTTFWTKPGLERDYGYQSLEFDTRRRRAGLSPRTGFRGLSPALRTC